MLLATARPFFFIWLLFAAVAVGAAESNASPDPGPDDESQSFSWGLGVVGLSMQQAYTDIDRNNFAIPLISFENRWVDWFGLGGELKLTKLKLAEDQVLSFGLALQYDPSGYEEEDSHYLRGMASRKGGIWAGFSSKWSNPVVDVGFQWLLDASDESGGQRIGLTLERSFFFGERLMVTPSFTATWLDAKYTDYYFGVRIEEENANRPAYFAEGTVNAQLSLRAIYMFNQRQSLLLTLDYAALGKEIKDSPLTDRTSETMLMAGYLFRFR